MGIGINWGYRSDAPDSNNVRKYSRYLKSRHFEKGLKPRFLNGNSGSLFISVLDFGSLVLFRLKDSQATLPSEVTFRQILAPGIQYVHGFRDSPFSLMLGAQLGPELRVLGQQSASGLRLNAALTVDIPVFNFATKTELDAKEDKEKDNEKQNN
jgi:hypothetical protein